MTEKIFKAAAGIVIAGVGLVLAREWVRDGQVADFSRWLETVEPSDFA